MRDAVIQKVLERIDSDGERFWRLADFNGLPFGAVAKALSRLTKAGHIQRMSKGIYYKPRQTVFGQSLPKLSGLQQLIEKSVFPAGRAAANLLGLSTQVAIKNEVSTTALSLPRKLLGQSTLVHRMRPATWTKLNRQNTALLELLRSRGLTSEMSELETIDRVLEIVSEPGCFEALVDVAASEPPRVRAMLGALGQQLGKSQELLEGLRATLNPLSKFDFGLFTHLKHAKQWQARVGGQIYETL